MKRVVVVGGSLAGVRACETLRHEEFNGDIVCISDEQHAPYDRPPLSKKFLSGEWDADRIALRRPEAIAELNVQWRTGSAAAHLDTSSNTVTLADGDTVSYDGLIIAAGGAVRRLPNQPGIAGVHVLRTLDQAAALRDDLAEGSRLVVIGAGFIGLEAAATAAQRGVHVTVLEGLPAPLIRALGADMGSAVAAVHERNGVHIRCGVKVARIVGGDRVTGVELSDGDVVPADTVLVGIGVAPATGWLEGSGLTLSDGVVCDASLCAGPANVFAAGDVARWPNALFADIEPLMRVEHWTNAAEQGAMAARNLLAADRGEVPTPYAAVPFFWSDQFDARIQFLGRTTSESHAEVVAGDVTSGKFCAMYVTNNRLTGVLGVSMPKLVMPSRALLSVHMSPDDARRWFAEKQASA
jgi:NADPH-dependent 2,4-dienoyl-CoA reductase/sulfur reductase-like enzyme